MVSFTIVNSVYGNFNVVYKTSYTKKLLSPFCKSDISPFVFPAVAFVRKRAETQFSIAETIRNVSAFRFSIAETFRTFSAFLRISELIQQC